MRLGALLSNDEYVEHKNKLVEEKARMKEKLQDATHRADHWLELSEKAFIFANNAKYWFESGSIQDKKKILACVGSNLLLKDGKLLTTVQKPFLVIRKGNEIVDWLPVVEEVRTFFANLTEYFEIPVLGKS